MKKINLLAKLGGFAFLAASPLVAARCGGESPYQNNAANEAAANEKKEDIVSKWDSEISITNGWVNKGFQGTKLETDFLELLGKRFNELKNKDSKTKDLPDVKFVIKVDGDGSYYTKLTADNKENDLYIANYTEYVNELWKDGKFNSAFAPKIVSQASTLQFTWGAGDNDVYVDGSAKDKLRVHADQNNIKWTKEIGKEYPEWSEVTGEGKTLHFDGSKYTNFYKKDKVTYVYHGAIYISGNKAKREEIVKAWEAKNWEDFYKHGISYKKTSSAGKYKYQAALLARHFGKDLAEINKFLQDNQEFVVRGKSAGDSLGKETQDKNTNKKLTPHISFGDEGEYNWTFSEKTGDNAGQFKPTKFQEGKPYDDAENDVVRVLTLTNPAPYDMVLGRTGLSQTQVNLISKALQSLSLEENQYGIYTGYNKFQPINMELLETLTKFQVRAESKQDFDKLSVVSPSAK
ncbi:ABC transporter substrate-binding protein [Mycoplasmopsis agalactiae]|uniref:ABC transporter thiamine pyrophosphate-binding lipoprotein p37/Cypl n=1 Tax=Mycoplasmopsis agalactiae TaxID=2110 RepID=UPI001FA5C508|nr:ABC transporter substrate-binding protein [Mycoplasmopsis agalactiae]MCE6061549.1 ABC transporter substrate-binding protein [Mycoplasmopsis agalactiae]